MKLTIISDTHNIKTLSGHLPHGDVLIHCGDVSSIGEEYEIVDFLNWFGNLEGFNYKIFIAGNHDFYFERYKNLTNDLILKYNKKHKQNGDIIYLENSSVIINNIKFYGSPFTPEFYNWAFNLKDDKLKYCWDTIDFDTDILITHGPPLGILDSYKRNNNQIVNIGCKYLKEKVFEIKPQIHCFGHNHSGYGIKQINEITFINASLLSEKYVLTKEPITIEI